MLPDGHTERSATVDDAEALYAMVAAANERVVGFADCTLDDIRDDLVEPGFDAATDSWLVHDPGGALVGMAWAYSKASGAQVDIEVCGEDPTIVDHLFTRVLARADEMAADQVSYAVDMGIYRAHEKLRAAASAHGFAPATAFHRMRADHDGPVPAPAPIPGLTLRTGPADEDFRRTAHRILCESFKGHFGWAAKTFEDWQETLDKDSAFDWPQLTVASLHGTPVAILLTDDSYVEDESCGYVACLGVLPEARGLGLATHLLRTAFSADAAAGRRGTLLHVDTNNTTPALTLYENAGMRPVLVIDAWRHTVTRTT